MRTREKTQPRLERRDPTDRRATPTRALRVRPPRRRSRFRRGNDAGRKYVDRLHPKIVAWAVTVVLLSAIDALFTLIHIHHGGNELIPTMRWALSVSQEAFLWIKLVVTAIGAGYLAAHYNFPVGRFCIRFVFFAYFFLMLYHGYVIWMRI